MFTWSPNTLGCPSDWEYTLPNMQSHLWWTNNPVKSTLQGATSQWECTLRLLLCTRVLFADSNSALSTLIHLTEATTQCDELQNAEEQQKHKHMFPTGLLCNTVLLLLWISINTPKSLLLMQEATKWLWQQPSLNYIKQSFQKHVRLI